MKKANVILILVVVILSSVSNVGFAQRQNKNQKINPERIIKFLDKNNDKKISKEEASNRKKLSENFDQLDANNDGYLTADELKGPDATKTNRYTYLESDGIFMYYETNEKDLYRKLLPEQFEMPDQLLVFTFISDFYKMDAETQPYKETSIFLLGKYKGQEMWHCVYMPVTSRESMMAGKYRLGLPKTMGEIDFYRYDPEYNAKVTDHNNGKVSLSIDTKNHSLSNEQKELLNELSVIPKMNILNGEVIEMTGGRNGSIFDLAERFPSKVVIKSGEGNIEFDMSAQKNNTDASPLGLEPSKILGAYYLSNKIPFRLGKK
ncbi:acetoacetate decarboxylase family protein [Aureivirga sp. CE67]|uniref:acetoacetate decarboxylase family protein n=1 Tax=Aureivirga sp. CE67 TaxID=1788983 RepID=UPI0018CA309D|nr:acetoacetate decarboxylase family protein [Aureivirga sp. CE67]